MRTGPRVLCLGHDKLLLQTRALILEPFFEVEQATGLKPLAAMSEREIDLVILCHSLSWRERFLASRMVLQMWPQAGVLEVLSSIQGTAAEDGNHVVLGLDGPLALIEAVRHILRGSAVSGDCSSRRSMPVELAASQS
jgi:hypothetical protein